MKNGDTVATQECLPVGIGGILWSRRQLFDDMRRERWRGKDLADIATARRKDPHIGFVIKKSTIDSRRVTKVRAAQGDASATLRATDIRDCCDHRIIKNDQFVRG